MPVAPRVNPYISTLQIVHCRGLQCSRGDPTCFCPSQLRFFSSVPRLFSAGNIARCLAEFLQARRFYFVGALGISLSFTCASILWIREVCTAVVVFQPALAPLSCNSSAQFPGFSLLETLHDIWSNSFCKQEIRTKPFVAMEAAMGACTATLLAFLLAESPGFFSAEYIA